MRTARPTTGTDLLVAGALAALLLPAPHRAAAAPPPDDAAVISVAGVDVTAADFLAYADALHPDRRDRAKVSAGEAAEGLVRNRLLAERASREGIDRNPAVRSRLLSRLSPLWNDLYWNDVVKPTLGTGEEELSAAAPPGEESVTVRQITASTREAAEEAAALVAAGTDFADVARDRSTGLTASRGGLVGEVKRGSPLYDPDVVERLFRMSPGEVTPVLPTRTGFAVLRVEGRTGADEARRLWMERNRSSFARRRERASWEKARGELLRRSGFILSRETLSSYRKAMRGGRSVASLLDRAAARVSGEEIRLRDVVDPAGTGTLHSWTEVEPMVRSKAEDVAVAIEADRLSLPAKHRKRARKEAFLRENLLAREYLSWKMRKVSATDEETREQYRAEPERYRLPRALDISLIETRSPERARRACEELAKGVPFAEAARRWSDSEGGKGGRAGLVEESSLDPALSPVRSLSPGEFTRSPLEVPAADGSGRVLVVARLNAVREERPLAYGEVDRDTLRGAVVARKRAEAVRALLGELSRERQVRILPAFREVAASAGFSPDTRPGGGAR